MQDFTFESVQDGLEWAEIVAAYLVANCKQFASGHCGGETHLAVVPREEGLPAFVKTDQEYMRELELYLFGIGHALEAVLPGGSPAMSPTAATLKARAKFITEAIERAETDSYQLPHEEVGDGVSVPDTPSPSSVPRLPEEGG